MPALRSVGLLFLALAVTACGGGGGGGGGGAGGGRALDPVDSLTPADGAVGVAPDVTITLRFRSSMDPPALLAGALFLTPAGTNSPVSATVSLSLDRMTATLTPDRDLESDRAYQVRLTEQARRADGRSIGRPWVAEFRTGGAGPAPPPGPPPQTGRVLAAGALEVGRSGHAGVALPGGGAAVFGGFDTSATVTDGIETWDPDTDTWTVAGAVLSTARGRLTATPLADGRVLLAGGETADVNDVGLDLVEVWSPSDGALTVAGSLVERRTGHTATRLVDGRVLIVGGSRTDSTGAPNFSRRTAEIWDPGTGTSTATGTMTVARAGHAAVLLTDGRVLVTGGHGTDGRAEVWDPAIGAWAVAGTLAAARRGHTATRLADGSVLVAGGGTFRAERWLPGESRFVAVGNLGDARTEHTAVRLPGGRVYIAGGERTGVGGSLFIHAGMEFYNPASQSFLFTSLTLRAPRSGHVLLALADGTFLLTGGKNPTLGLPARRSCDRVELD